jgi:hypothetical protein
VLHLEPTRSAATIGCIVMAILVAAVAVAALVYRTDSWPEGWRPPEPVPDRVPLIVAGVAGFFALLLLIGAVVNGRRWRTSRTVERLSEDPALLPFLPDTAASPPMRRAAVVPPLEVTFVRPGKLPKLRVKLQRVSVDRNVIGRRPLQIAYLRLFENQPRIRTFVEGAWREFGYVYFLRSAASVTPPELRLARDSGDLSAMFVASRERLLVECRRRAGQVDPKGRARYANVGNATIRVRDRYGSYPLCPLLCHGAFWKSAVDALLERVDLVVLDLSGFRPENAGTRYELQRVVDRFQIEHVVFLADPQSNQRFLTAQIQEAWSFMAEGSPNAIGTPKQAVIAVTDYFYADSSMQSNSSQVNTRLMARRPETRRVAAMAQNRIEHTPSTGAPAAARTPG